MEIPETAGIFLILEQDFMNETIRLYDAQPYSTEFDAEILSAREGLPGTAEVILSATLFFPEEGGQTPDRGTLAGFPVFDVQL